MQDENLVKMAVISGASHALRYKQKSPRITDEEILRRVTQEVDEIISKIGLDD